MLGVVVAVLLAASCASAKPTDITVMVSSGGARAQAAGLGALHALHDATETGRFRMFGSKETPKYNIKQLMGVSGGGWAIGTFNPEFSSPEEYLHASGWNGQSPKWKFFSSAIPLKFNYPALKSWERVVDKCMGLKSGKTGNKIPKYICTNSCEFSGGFPFVSNYYVHKEPCYHDTASDMMRCVAVKDPHVKIPVLRSNKPIAYTLREAFSKYEIKSMPPGSEWPVKDCKVLYGSIKYMACSDRWRSPYQERHAYVFSSGAHAEGARVLRKTSWKTSIFTPVAAKLAPGLGITYTDPNTGASKCVTRRFCDMGPFCSWPLTPLLRDLQRGERTIVSDRYLLVDATDCSWVPSPEIYVEQAAKCGALVKGTLDAEHNPDLVLKSYQGSGDHRETHYYLELWYKNQVQYTIDIVPIPNALCKRFTTTRLVWPTSYSAGDFKEIFNIWYDLAKRMDEDRAFTDHKSNDSVVDMRLEALEEEGEEKNQQGVEYSAPHGRHHGSHHASHHHRRHAVL